MIKNQQSITKCLNKIKEQIVNNKSNAEAFEFLYRLELNELVEIASIIERSFVNLDKKLFELLKFLDIETRINILDDLYDNNIKQYKVYLHQKLEIIEKLLDECVNYLNELFTLNYEVNKNNYYNYINISLDDKEKLINNIADVCSSLMEFKKDDLINWNLFSSPKNPYSYQVIKLLNNDLKEYIEDMRKLLQVNSDYKNVLLEFTKYLKKLLEEDTNLIIDSNSIFKDKLSFEQYEILERYNCLEKIGLIKYPSYVSFDLSDVVYFLENCQILRIIDCGQEIIINEGQPDKLIRIALRSDYDELGLNEISKDQNFDLTHYCCQDLITYDGKGNNRKLIILLRTIK